MPDKPQSSLPSWVMPLLSMVLSIVVSLVTFSYKYGGLEQRVVTLEADKSKREGDAAAKLAAYEQERAARMARIEAIAERLNQVPPNPPATLPR